MVPTHYQANAYANLLRARFVFAKADGFDIAAEAVEKDRYLAISALGIFDADMRSGEITFDTPEVNQLLDYIEKAYSLIWGKSTQVADCGFYHRRGLEEWMRKRAVSSNN